MEFDTLIRNGTVVDGSGQTPAARADVGIVGDRIAAIGALDGATAARTIDATGQVVSPGFIDVHVHSEIELLGGPRRYGALAQGVTTQLLAPDGFGWAQLPPERARELYEYTLFAYGKRDLSLRLADAGGLPGALRRQHAGERAAAGAALRGAPRRARLGAAPGDQCRGRRNGRVDARLV